MLAKLFRRPLTKQKTEMRGKAANRTGGRLKTAYTQASCPLLT